MAKYELIIYMRDDLIRNIDDTYKEFKKTLGAKSPEDCKVILDYKQVKEVDKNSSTLGMGIMDISKKHKVKEIVIKNHPLKEEIKNQPMLKLLVSRGVLEVE